MVSYPDLGDISGSGDIGALLSLPNSSYPFYWGLMMVALWFIISLTIFFKEKSLTTKGNMLSAMAVSSFAVIILSTVGTLFGIMTLEIFLPLLVAGLLIIAIWIMS